MVPGAARSLIHEGDTADAAVRARTEPGHCSAAYVLTGPAAITQAKQVRILATAAGRPARVEEATPGEARKETLAWADPDFVDGALVYASSLVDSPGG